MKKRSLIIILVSFVTILMTYFSINASDFSDFNFYFLDENLTNNKQVEPRKLFLNSWKIVRKRYYDSTLNKQDWNKWKNRYIDLIETEEDAYLAINSMLASLDDELHSNGRLPRFTQRIDDEYCAGSKR